MIVAIDGPAGSGKSTVARALSDRLDLIFLDTGAMYRSVTVECLRQGIDMTDTEKIIQVARSISISFGNSANGQTVFANGSNVTTEIRTPEVDRNVSAVAAIPEVREAMVTLQRRAGENGDVVAEGRDIGTVVFPEADVKVFLTADPAARAHRRAVQRQGGDAA
ncbi:MAG: (d)CMP kinase, partial [Atopobium sp.]|nr:(d)CMP kinase [Atopobium sp.]